MSLEVARHLLPSFPDGVFGAELGLLSSPELVPATVASALGLTDVVRTLSHEGVAGAVGTKKLLLVIDNCEHVIEAAAGMAEALFRASPGVSLLAASREPLRVSGEYVYRVPQLDVPAEDTQDMQDVFRYGAARLFVSRAHPAEPRYVAEGPVATATAAICRWFARASRRLGRRTSASINSTSECSSIATTRAFSGCRDLAIRQGGSQRVSSIMSARRNTCSRFVSGRSRLGAAGRDEPRSALARPAAGEPGPQAAGACLPPLHRGVRNRRPHRRRDAPRLASMNEGPAP
jgi:hypothetical protein